MPDTIHVFVTYITDEVVTKNKFRKSDFYFNIKYTAGNS